METASIVNPRFKQQTKSYYLAMRGIKKSSGRVAGKQKDPRHPFAVNAGGGLRKCSHGSTGIFYYVCGDSRYHNCGVLPVNDLTQWGV